MTLRERVAAALEVELRAQIPQALKHADDQRPRWGYSERLRQLLAAFVARMEQARTRARSRSWRRRPATR